MTETDQPAGVRAPTRRPLGGRPRTPRPPGRSREKPTGRLGRQVTRVVTQLDRGVVGGWIRGLLRRSCRPSEHEITLGRGRLDLDGMRIAMLSDLHVGFFFSEAEFAELARQVSAWRPDLVCLVGDLIDHEVEQFRLLRPGLAQLRARHGVVAVPGNHEYAAERDLKHFQEALAEAGVLLLNNRGTRVERGSATLFVAGVDDLTAGDPDLAAALHGLQPEEPALLLAHHPDLFREAAHVGVDLVLSGHTHGGQITWFGTPMPSLQHSAFGYWQGRHELDGAQLVVGRGVGTCVLPVRIAAPPEILLIELKV